MKKYFTKIFNPDLEDPVHAGVVRGPVPDLAHEADLRAEVVVELRAAAGPRHAAVVAGVNPGGRVK